MLGRLPGRGRPGPRHHAPTPAAPARPPAPAGGPLPPGGTAMTASRFHRADGSRPRPPRWLDPRGRHLGTWAFVANRVTGLGLVGYLYLHLAILSTLLRGPEAWDG